MSSSPNPIQESIDQETTTRSDSNPPESVEESQESKKGSRPNDDPAELPEEEEAEEEEEESSAPPPPPPPPVTLPLPPGEGGSGRERLKRHRVEVAGRVWIPDMWGQEGLLKEWADCTNFDASLVRSSILMARDSLANDGRRVHSTELTLRNSC